MFFSENASKENLPSRINIFPNKSLGIPDIMVDGGKNDDDGKMGLKEIRRDGY